MSRCASSQVTRKWSCAREIRGKGDPVQLDYRLAKMGDVWKIYDVNVLGIWLGDQYRNSFAQEIGVTGIDGLIKSLAEKNAGSQPAATKAWTVVAGLQPFAQLGFAEAASAWAQLEPALRAEALQACSGAGRELWPRPPSSGFDSARHAHALLLRAPAAEHGLRLVVSHVPES